MGSETYVLTTLRQTVHLLGHERRGRWLLLVVLALLLSGIEMVGAFLVYLLLELVSDPNAQIELPVVGDLREMFGGIDQQSLLLGVVAAMAVFFLSRGLIRVGATYVKTRLVHNAAARLSNRLVSGYLRWPYAQHLQRNSAELIRNGHQAVDGIFSGVVLPVIKIASEGLLVVGMLVVLLTVAPAATGLAVLVVGGAAVLLLIVIQPKLKRLGRVHHRESRETLHAFQQALHGIRDVKILGREREFARVYTRSRKRMARAKYLKATAAELPRVVIETALFGFILLFFALSLIRGDAANENIAVLGLFGYAGLRIAPSLQTVIQGLNSLRYASAPTEDIYADLVAVESYPEPPATVTPLPFESSWKLENVRFRYDGADRDALAGVNLDVHPGEQIGICGPTGGGKTTLVDVMTGLLEPTDGTVTVDGVDLMTNARAWHQQLGVVPQMVFLTDDTLRRNIALGVPDREIDEEALAEAIELAQLGGFVRTLTHGLDTTVGERGVRISGGQRQRIAIARALYRRPSALVFDEGTSALDTATEAELMGAVERLRGHHTIILIAHRLSTVRSSDRVVFVEDGRVSGEGTYSMLLQDHGGFRALAGDG